MARFITTSCPGLDVWGLTLEETRALLEKEFANTSLGLKFA